jgi:hypothetical protein
MGAAARPYPNVGGGTAIPQRGGEHDGRPRHRRASMASGLAACGPSPDDGTAACGPSPPWPAGGMAAVPSIGSTTLPRLP